MIRVHLYVRRSIMIAIMVLLVLRSHGQSVIDSQILALSGVFQKCDVNIPFHAFTNNPKVRSDIMQIAPSASLLTLDTEGFKQVTHSGEELLVIDLPVSADQPIELWLQKAQIFSDDLQIRLGSNPDKLQKYDLGNHYHGIVKGKPGSIAALSIYANEITGLLSYNGQNYTLGRLWNNDGNTYILYSEEELRDLPPFNCLTSDIEAVLPEHSMTNFQRTGSTEKCVRVSVEVDHDVFLSKGTSITSVNFVSSIFNESLLVYKNEGITMQVSEFYIWDIPSPHYTSGSLIQFFQNPDFNGDLRHLIFYGVSGFASRSVCSKEENAKCFSGIPPFYEYFPVFSAAVKRVTHEMGHLLGSRHTHACVWNGDSTAIDGCAGYVEGDCSLPADSLTIGTIMSYCYDFALSNGFGQQPGDVIRNFVSSAECLLPCNTNKANDAGIETILNSPINTCDPVIYPEVVLKNYGIDSLFTVHLISEVNGQVVADIQWNKGLAPGEVDTVALTPIEVNEGGHILSIYTQAPNLSADETPDNDKYETTVGSGSVVLDLLIVADSTSSNSIFWHIRDNIGNMIASGGPYASIAGQQIELQICVPDEQCLRFEIFDKHGDGLCCAHGMGYYELRSSIDNTILTRGGEFLGRETSWICPYAQWCWDDTSFPDSSLSHTGADSSVMSVSFPENPGMLELEIYDLDYRLNVGSTERYVDIVTVSYTTFEDEIIVRGVFDARDSSHVIIELPANTSEVSVSLRNGIANNREVQVTLSPIMHCKLVSTGIEPLSQLMEHDLVVFPNPATTYLNISLNDAYSGIATVEIVGIDGHVVEINQVHLTALQTMIRVAHLPPAIYFMKVTNSEGKSLIQKFVKCE